MTTGILQNLSMALKAQRILNSISAATIPPVIASPLTPVDALFTGTINAAPNAANNSLTCLAFGGPVIQNGDGAWQVCPVTSGYGYRQPSRGAVVVTIFDGISLQVISRQYAAVSENHRLMVNGQWVTTGDHAFASGTADNTYSTTYNLSSFGPVGTQKEIQLYMDENFHFKGFASTTPSDRFYAPLSHDIAPLSCVAFGDSYFDGQQDPSLFGGMRGALQEALGFYVNPCGLGGQGWANSSNGFATHTQRVAAGDLNQGNGTDLIFLAGSINDVGQTTTTVRTNLATSLTTVRAQNPNAFIVFISGFRATGKVPSFNAATPNDPTTLHGAELSGFADALGQDAYAVLIDGFTADNNAGWSVLSGTTSNIARYQDADQTHQNGLGYRYLADRIVSQFGAWLKTKTAI